MGREIGTSVANQGLRVRCNQQRSVLMATALAVIIVAGLAIGGLWLFWQIAKHTSPWFWLMLSLLAGGE